MYKTGDTLGGCRLLQECGSGAFGSVFLAENETTHQRVALKILPKTGHHYERELSALRSYQEKCRHANLMRIYHIGQNDDCIFYTLDAADPLNPDGDYIPDTLGNRLRQRKRLTPEEIRTMLNELLDGLEILHNAGLLHRDIKPDNVLWVERHAVLGDIGLVTEADDASFAGTRGFISPAVWKGERGYSKQDDLYALAMTLYCALTGNEPKGNLELPLSMTFSGCGDLIRAYNAVMEEDSAVCSVAAFRAVLLKRRNLLSKKHRKRILPAFLVTVLCTLLAISIYDKIEPLNDDPVQNRAEEGSNFITYKSKFKNAPTQKIKRNQETNPPPRKKPSIPKTSSQETPAKKDREKVPTAAEVTFQPQQTPSARKSAESKAAQTRNNVTVKRIPSESRKHGVGGNNLLFLTTVPSEQEQERQDRLFDKYRALVSRVEQSAPIPEVIRKNLQKMTDWYLKHQHDYKITSEKDEREVERYRKIAEEQIRPLRSGFEWRKSSLEMRIKDAVDGAEKARLQKEYENLINSHERVFQKRMDEMIQRHRARHAAYRQLSPFKQAAFAYAMQNFDSSLLKQDLLIITHHDYDEKKMKQIYEEWVAAYRKLKELERKLLPIFAPEELD